MHRRIYRAIRAHDPVAAREAMAEHLRAAQHAHTLELEAAPDGHGTTGENQED
jgi:DNA-binding FadR family transcriptional regulator